MLDWDWLTATAIGRIGTWAISAWYIAILLQGIACVSYLEMASMFKDTSGSLPVFVHNAFKKYGEFPGALASWGYVIGWGAAPIALVIFAGYFVQETLFPSLNITYFATVVLLAVFLINYLGVDVWSRVSSLISVTVIISLVVCIGTWFLPPSSLENAAGFAYAGESPDLFSFIGIVYILAWSAYSSENVFSLTAEYKDPVKDTKKALITTIAYFILGTTFVTLTYMHTLSVNTMLENPYTPLLPLSSMLAGHRGEFVVMCAMVLGLVLNMNSCFIAASRVLYQNGKEGTNLKQFGYLNKHNSPHAALFFIFLLNLFMVIMFGEEPIAILRAGDVGYFVTVILANLSAFMLRRQMPDAERPYRAPDIFIYLSLGIAGINFILVTVGIWSWGITRVLISLSLLLTFLPLYYYRKLVQDKREKPNLSLDTPASV